MYTYTFWKYKVSQSKMIAWIVGHAYPQSEVNWWSSFGREALWPFFLGLNSTTHPRFSNLEKPSILGIFPHKLRSTALTHVTYLSNPFIWLIWTIRIIKTINTYSPSIVPGGGEKYLYALPGTNLLLVRKAKLSQRSSYATSYHQRPKPAIDQVYIKDIARPKTSRTECAPGYDSPQHVSMISKCDLLSQIVSVRCDS